jgi:hypothetical protein
MSYWVVCMMVGVYSSSPYSFSLYIPGKGDRYTLWDQISCVYRVNLMLIMEIFIKISNIAQIIRVDNGCSEVASVLGYGAARMALLLLFAID